MFTLFQIFGHLTFVKKQITGLFLGKGQVAKNLKQSKHSVLVWLNSLWNFYWDIQCFNFVCLIWFFTSHQQSLSYIGMIFLGWTSIEVGLMFLLKDTTQWRQWGLNQRPLGLESSTLPVEPLCSLIVLIDPVITIPTLQTKIYWLSRKYWVSSLYYISIYSSG